MIEVNLVDRDSKVGRASTVAAAVCLSVIGTAVFLILPQFIGAAVADLGFSDREVGFLSAILMAGSTLSAIAATYWVRRISWRVAGMVAAGGVIATSALSLYWHDVWRFMMLQGLCGFFGGSLYSLALTVLSDGRQADRHFGYAVAAQVAFQVAGLLAGPWLSRAGGINAFLILFISLNALVVLLVQALPNRADRLAYHDQRERLWTQRTIFALTGCLLFFFNIGCYWTYVELIGAAAGLGAQAVADGLAIGVAFGIAGALLASWLGDRKGRLLPIGASAVLTVLAVSPLLAHVTLTAFIGSAIIYNFVWNLSLSYQYSTVNAVDRSGRGVAAAPAFHAGGGSAGPAVAALLIGPGNYGPVIFLIAVSVMLSYACFALASRPRPAGSL
jgi:MFS family permease